MNKDDQASEIDVCRGVKKYIERLTRFREANEISDDEFCENSLRILIQGGRACWHNAIRSFTPEMRSTLQAYCGETIGEDYAPPAAAFLPGDATEEELNAKCAELRKEYIELARAVVSTSRQ